MEKPRNLAFDACKGLAIYAVVMIHVETVLTWRIPTETVAMPAFFFISGYFFSRYFLSSERGESKQFLKKCKRLFLPFLVWSCVALIFNLVLEILKNGGIIGFAEIVRTQSFDIFIHARSLWFLICLFYTFVFTLLCHCIGRMACPNSKYAGLIIAIIGYALLYLFVYDAADNSFLRFFKFQWLYPYFLFGCVIRREAIEGFLAFACNHRVAFLASALCVLGLMYVSYDREAYTLWCEPDARARGGVLFLTVYYLIGAAGTLSLLGISGLLSKTKRVGPILVDIGKYSLDVYVMHMFFVKVLLMFLPGGFVESGLYAYVVAPLMGMVIVAATYLLAKKVFSRIPVYRYLMR